MKMQKEISYVRTLLRDNIEELGGTAQASPEAIDAAIQRSSLALELLDKAFEERKKRISHCILVKFRERGWEEELPAIMSIFQRTLLIPGIHTVTCSENAVHRDNRYDLLIQIEMDRDALEDYDACEAHLEWKKKYGPMLEKKAIFDKEV